MIGFQLVKRFRIAAPDVEVVDENVLPVGCRISGEFVVKHRLAVADGHGGDLTVVHVVAGNIHRARFADLVHRHIEEEMGGGLAPGAEKRIVHGDKGVFRFVPVEIQIGVAGHFEFQRVHPFFLGDKPYLRLLPGTGFPVVARLAVIGYGILENRLAAGRIDRKRQRVAAGAAVAVTLEKGSRKYLLRLLVSI